MKSGSSPKYVLDCTLHYGRTLSAGEAKPPRAGMTSVIKALPQDVAFLAFILMSLPAGSRLSRFSRWSRRPSLHVLFPLARTGFGIEPEILLKI
jgi:hypothetical protein